PHTPPSSTVVGECSGTRPPGPIDAALGLGEQGWACPIGSRSKSHCSVVHSRSTRWPTKRLTPRRSGPWPLAAAIPGTSSSSTNREADPRASRGVDDELPTVCRECNGDGRIETGRQIDGRLDLPRLHAHE